MGVDWQAFATAFLNGTALNIKERKDDADEYKDELTEKAEDNKALLSTRKSAAQAAYQHILTAKELGADAVLVNTANIKYEVNTSKRGFSKRSSWRRMDSSRCIS